MRQITEAALEQAATREIKKLYFVLLRILEEDTFLGQDDLQIHAVRLARIFRNGTGIYRRRNLAEDDLKEDFDNLFDKLVEATLADELYEKTANLKRVRALFDDQVLEPVAQGMLSMTPEGVVY